MSESGIILPKHMQPAKPVTAMIEIPFTFTDKEDFNAIVLRLDQTFNDERNKAVEAIAKMMGLKVNLTDEE